MNYFVIGFYFGLGFALANTVLVIIDKILVTLFLKYKVFTAFKY